MKRNGGLPNSADTIEESGVGRDKHVMDGLKLGFTPDQGRGNGGQRSVVNFAAAVFQIERIFCLPGLLGSFFRFG